MGFLKYSSHKSKFLSQNRPRISPKWSKSKTVCLTEWAYCPRCILMSTQLLYVRLSALSWLNCWTYGPNIWYTGSNMHPAWQNDCGLWDMEVPQCWGIFICYIHCKKSSKTHCSVHTIGSTNPDRHTQTGPIRLPRLLTWKVKMSIRFYLLTDQTFIRL